MKSRTWTSILAYTSARILMFGCAVILLYVAGARGVLLLGLGLVISALASYILLNRQRAIIADRLNGRLGKAGSKATSKVTAKAAELRGRLEEGTKAEDAEDEEEAVRLVRGRLVRGTRKTSQPPRVSCASTAATASWRETTEVSITRSASSGSSYGSEIPVNEPMIPARACA